MVLKLLCDEHELFSIKQAPLIKVNERCARLIYTLFAQLKSGGVHYAPLERTFRLYAGSSLYAFRVDDLGQLEHLYWGEAIPLTQDLAYCINTQLTFETTPVHPHSSASDNLSSQQHLFISRQRSHKGSGRQDR